STNVLTGPEDGLSKMTGTKDVTVKSFELIIQGANDPRVVKNESDQIVERLRNKGIGVEYMVFDDEGHGFTKYSNLIMALKKSAEFLTNKLSL
ncbi:MAG: prolyl oligopeptidase family serine peptidase, partial [Nitrososphaeraceae archaeon]